MRRRLTAWALKEAARPAEAHRRKAERRFFGVEQTVAAEDVLWLVLEQLTAMVVRGE